MAECDSSKCRESGTPDEKQVITIALAGKSGAGKSSLSKKILDMEEELEISSDIITTVNNFQDITKNGVTIRVIDTVGLAGPKGKKKKELKKLSKYTTQTECNVDILIYCISVSPGAKFDQDNCDIMKLLQDTYGPDIWKHCIVALTFSNLALERCKKKKSQDEYIAKYRDYLLEFTNCFEKELKKMKDKNVFVQLVSGLQKPEDHSDNADIKELLRFAIPTRNISTDDHNKIAIVAIPAGDDLDDPVLPDIEEPAGFTITIPTSSKSTGQPVSISKQVVVIKSWTDLFFIEILRKSDSKHHENLLKYRYGAELVVGGGVMGGLGMAVVGAGVGAGVGLIFGPLGVATGAIAGTVAGAITGGVIGAAGGRALSRRKKKEKEPSCTHTNL